MAKRRNPFPFSVTQLASRFGIRSGDVNSKLVELGYQYETGEKMPGVYMKFAPTEKGETRCMVKARKAESGHYAGKELRWLCWDDGILEEFRAIYGRSPHERLSELESKVESLTKQLEDMSIAVEELRQDRNQILARMASLGYSQI
jgi:hypothetical protein